MAERSRITLRDVIGSLCSAPDCDDTSLEDVPLPICSAHYAELVRHFFEISRGRNLARSEMDLALGTGEMAPVPPLRVIPSYVYFIRFRDRIKIGTTTTLTGRLAQLPFDEILAVIPGSYDVESEWHHRYAGHREQGEWFNYTEGMLSTIRGLGICAA
jgi:hypothetical protein